MKKTSMFQRMLSLALALVMVLGYIPNITPHAHAASNVDGGLEGQAADVFTALGFDTTVEPEGYDADTVDNPYGRNKVLANQVFEMVIASDDGVNRAGNDNNSLHVGNVVGSSLSGSMPLMQFTSAAGDFDGDGLPGEVVYVGIEEYSLHDLKSDDIPIKMLTYDGKTNTFNGSKTIGSTGITNWIYGVSETLTLIQNRSWDYDIQNFLQVTAGDYDGDGYSEIAVYVPEEGNARVDIYKWMRDKNSKDTDWKNFSNWSVVWSYVVSNADKYYYVPNMVSLLSADINMDGIDDLAVSSGNVRFSRTAMSDKFDYFTDTTAAIMWGARDGMLQTSTPINLQENSLGEMTRVSLTMGDINLDGYDELVVTGHPTTGFEANDTRGVIIYSYDGAGGLASIYTGLVKPVDGVYEVVEENGKTTKKWSSANGFDDTYRSKPYMRTNSAVVRLNGYEYAYLYLDSCLYEYVEGNLRIDMALDDAKYDGTNTLGATWLTENNYAEYGAVAADINGDGFDQLYTSFYDERSYGQYYKTSYTDFYSEMNFQNHVGGYSGLEGSGSGTLTAKTTSGSYAVDNNTTDGETVTYEDEQVFCYSIAAADVDDDTFILEYTGNHWLTYQDPQVLAVIAAAPYFEDVDVICDYDYAWQNTTSWSKTEGTGEGSTIQVDLEAGAYISQGSDFNELEVATLFTMEWVKETTDTTEYTLTFETSQDEDAVAFFSIPTEHYEYVLYTPDGSGGYKEEPYVVNRPFQAVYQVLNLDYYESIRVNYPTLPAIRGEILTSTPGDPASYPNSTTGLDVISKWNQDPAGVSFGNGAITQEITVTHEESESYNLGGAIDTTIGGGYDGASVSFMAGVTFSLNPSGGWVDYDISGTTISGTVTNMPLEFQDYGYYYNWALFSYAAKVGGATVPVVSYLVNDVAEPPKLPDDFQQDVSRTTSDKNVLTWTYDEEYTKFIIYKYLDFPVEGGLEVIAEYAAGQTPYTIKYDENGSPYKEFYFEDTNLAPYSEYQYAIQVERLNEIPPLSAASALVTARTKASVGNPVLTVVESDGTNDGKAQIYPDKNAYLIAQVNGPDGEDGTAYYSVIQYQWQKKNDHGKWENMVNETNQTLTIASAGADEAGEYRCRVNVITNTDNTAISAFTGAVELVHSKRTTVIEEAYARDLNGSVELYAKVENTHTDSATVPDGYVTFNFVNTATGASYPVNVQLNSEGVASVVSNNALPQGQYRVTVTYSGSYVFKSCTTTVYYLSSQTSGYAMDALSSITYGDGTTVIFNKLTSVSGHAVSTPVDAESVQLLTAVVFDLMWSSVLDDNPIVTVGSEVEAGDIVWHKLEGTNWYIRYIVPVSGTVAGFSDWTLLIDADLVYETEVVSSTGSKPDGLIVTNGSVVEAGQTFYYYDQGPSLYFGFVAPASGTVKCTNYRDLCIVADPVTYTGETGVYQIKDAVPAGSYVIRATASDGTQVENKLAVNPRPITLQLPTLSQVQGAWMTMGDILYEDLTVVSGSWARCDADVNGEVMDPVASTSVSPSYTNTAGTVFNKDSKRETCGYYTITAKDTLNNYAVTYRTGSLSIVGDKQNLNFAVRAFEGQQVGTLYLVSPEYAYTREAKGMTVYETVGSRVVFTAAPDEGYQVYDWYVNGVAQGISDTRFSMDMLNQTMKVEVQFVFKPDTLVFGIAGDQNGGTLTCSDTGLTSGSIVVPNTYLTYTATAAEGYHFKEWRYTELGSGTAYYTEDDGKQSSTFELLMPKTSCSLYAVFERDGYKLTYTDKLGNDGLTAWYWGNLSGDTTAQLEKITVNSGDSVPGDTEIVVEAKNGFQLHEDYNFIATGSQGTADYENGTYTLILTEDTEVAGYTVQNFFDVEVAFDVAKTYHFPDGTQVTLNVGDDQYTYDCPTDSTTYKVLDIPGGTKVSVSISYPGYYTFSGWDVNGTVAESESYSISGLGEDTVLTLKLTEKPVYKVTLANISGKGTYTVTLPDGAGQSGNVVTCHENDPLTIQVTPATGYTVTYWKVASANTSDSWETKASSLKYQFPTLRSNYTFTPVFSNSTYHTVTWSTLTYYGVTLTPESGYLSTVSSGDDFKFTLSGGDYVEVHSNGLEFRAEASAGDWPFTYKDGVYTIHNITGNQEITVSDGIGYIEMLTVSPMTPIMIEGKEITLTANAQGFTAELFHWYTKDDSGNKTTLQKSPSNVLVYQGDAAQIFVDALVLHNGELVLHTRSVNISVEPAVEDIQVTEKTLTAEEDGSFLIYPITPDNTIGTYAFDAKVTLTDGTTPEDITWTLWGAQMRGTSIDENGVLTVSDKEYGTNGQLKITVTYTYKNGDTEKKEIIINLSTDAYVAAEVVNDLHGSVEEIGYVSGGESVTITAEPDENHAIAGWTINGVAVSVWDEEANSLTFAVEEMTHYAVTVEFTHYYPTAENDETNHWYECSCGDKTEVEEHYDFDRNHFCDKCGYEMSKCADDDKDHNCDYCGAELTQCADEDPKDHNCDWCGDTLTVCTDEDKDHVCDWCGETISECADDNNNHFCDWCKKTLSECVDNSRDHNCDICGRELSTCADTDNDHLCDVCVQPLSECKDEDKDHLCDVCGGTASECIDENKDHNCDICGKEALTECVDTEPLDHKCDICGETMTECADEDPADHKCDICDDTISSCVDEDPKDHNCDICGKEGITECADADDNHLCDVCNKVLSECADEDDDHLCDTCGKKLSECADEDSDHYCDTCGKHLTPCVDEDPADDVCDICGKELNVHDCVDENSDHKCDTCGKEISQCADNDSDHSCDICGKALTECADTDNDHKCDTCGEVLSECEDTDKDHKCDTCGAAVSQCTDGNKDHKCDICGAELSSCADENSDHKCDTCGAVLSECADAEPKDHKCDTCGVILSTCAEGDTVDHKCDVCGAEINAHTDENGDHYCDTQVCGKKLSDCIDADADHACDTCGADMGTHEAAEGKHTCDYCGEAVTECEDIDSDHKCDTCGKVLTQCVDTDPADGKCDVCGADMHECADAEPHDHVCDHCGYVLTACVDEDDDHKCDICGETNSLCADNDSDHKCDICGANLTECTDADDHKCDICGETVSDCYDHNHDDVCDLCGAETNVHADENNDHRCDVCALPLTECDDTNSDHMCDVCGIAWTKCTDRNKDHACDICNVFMGVHEHSEGSHICDYCGESTGDCADGDNDHLCDICSEELTTCLDDNKDHLCDICGKELTKCADEDSDHYCDICGKELSQCTDDDKDGGCDHCDESMVYTITVNPSVGGTVTSDKETAVKGETVTLTVVPGEARSLVTITAVAENGAAVYLTDNGDGTYTFIQPIGDVTVEATFAEGLFSISFASMTMANSLDMNFAFKQAYREDWSGYYAKIEKEYQNAENAVQYIFFEDWKTTTISGEAYYYVTFTGIAAKEMTDALYVTVYDADGNAVSTVWEDSVQSQAMRNLAKVNVTEKAQTMVVDMLNYGAAAQQRFEYNLDNLANSLLSEEQKTFATETVSYVDISVRGDNYRANVYLVSNIQFMMAFTGVDQTMNAVITFKDHYNKTHEITISGSEFVKNGSYYVLTIEETVIADAYQNINCKIYDADGSLVTEVTDSMASYAARAKQNTGNELYEMIMKFATSAYAYLHNK